MATPAHTRARPRPAKRTAGEEPAFVAVDAYEERILSSPLRYPDKAALIGKHREHLARALAELGVGKPAGVPKEGC
jgi:hypothetical protein